MYISVHKHTHTHTHTHTHALTHTHTYTHTHRRERDNTQLETREKKNPGHKLWSTMSSVNVPTLDLAKKVLHARILLTIHYCVPQSDYNWWVGIVRLTAIRYGGGGGGAVRL